MCNLKNFTEAGLSLPLCCCVNHDNVTFYVDPYRGHLWDPSGIRVATLARFFPSIGFFASGVSWTMNFQTCAPGLGNSRLNRFRFPGLLCQVLL
jgi:hypothetical protein